MSENLSMRARWARRLIRKKLSEELNALQHRGSTNGAGGDGLHVPFGTGDGSPWTIDNLPPVPLDLRDSRPDAQQLKVCIIGAGMSGLYTAMILEHLKTKIPGLSYEILEGSDRVGGRVYTHYFSEAKHDYYDIGAMRFPDIPLMQPVFNLFRQFNLPMIPYYLSKGAVNTPSLFNDILKYNAKDGGEDIFKVSRANGGMVPDEFVKEGPSKIMHDVFEPYEAELGKNFETGFENLLKQDLYTTRSYLLNTKFNNFFAIQWLETFGSASGLYDEAFTESVIDSFDFDNALDPDWYCIDGGTSLLAKAMEKSLNQNVELSKQVTGISLDRTGSNPQILVEIGNNEVRKYDTVFCTTTLGCMQRMDLRGVELHPTQKDAIRTLHYDSASKVAIKFSHPWWITKFNITSGGSASTDLPIRACVYPSYNLHDGPDHEAVLLCCYTWAQDSERIGSLVSRSSPEGEEELKELVLRDLARLHAPEEDFKKTYDYIKDSYMTHHAWDFYQDPFTSGAFALFGAGQFQNYYPLMSRPAADSRLHFVGEATSAHHAWIVGALDSALRTTVNFLHRFGLRGEVEHLEKFERSPGEVELGDNGTAHLQVALGMLHKGQHVVV